MLVRLQPIARMGDTTRREALARDISRRLQLCTVEELELVDEAMLEVERDRHGVPGKSEAFTVFMQRYRAGGS